MSGCTFEAIIIIKVLRLGNLTLQGPNVKEHAASLINTGHLSYDRKEEVGWRMAGDMYDIPASFFPPNSPPLAKASDQWSFIRICGEKASVQEASNRRMDLESLLYGFRSSGTEPQFRGQSSVSISSHVPPPTTMTLET